MKRKHRDFDMLIAQVTDTHIKSEGRLAYGKVDTAANLARCVEHLVRLDPRPDIVLMTGDLADFGRPEEYRLLRRLIAPLECPVHVIPGNHDDREISAAPSRTMTTCRATGVLQYVLEDYPVRLIGLDTTIPVHAGGTMCTLRLQWLDRTLAAGPRSADRHLHASSSVPDRHHPHGRSELRRRRRAGSAD